MSYDDYYGDHYDDHTTTDADTEADTEADTDAGTGSDSDADVDVDEGSGGILRRDYLAGTALAAFAGGSYLAQISTNTSTSTSTSTSTGTVEEISPDDRVLNSGRFIDVYSYREEEARKLLRPVPDLNVVDDQGDGLDGFLERFTRGLPHNDDLTVDADVYASYLGALGEGGNAAWDGVQRGGSRPFIDPNSSTTMPILGMDTHEFVMDPPPAIGSEAVAADLTELYWMSLLRDVPFQMYSQHPLAQQAAADLSRFSEDAYVAHRDGNGDITTDLLFRGPLGGSQVGPYMSQFMLQDAPFGAHEITQQIRVAEPGIDFLEDRETFISDRNGTGLDGGPDGTLATSHPDDQVFDDTRRFMRTGRDVTSCVQRDVVPGQFLIAVMIVLQRPVDGVPPNPEEVYDASNPEIDNESIHTFVNYARTHFLDMMTRAGRQALMNAWFNKWQVFRRARPCKLAGMIDLSLNDDEDVDYLDLFHPTMSEVDALDAVFQDRGTHLLGSSYAEGCPYHPSYPGGHAVVASAAATVGKAMLNEDYVIPNPVQANVDGTELVPYEGSDADQLTVGNELNKMVDNVNVGGRQMAGMHYRSDYVGQVASYALGEQVAIRLLEDVKGQTEEAAGFEFTSFSGSTVTI